MFQVEITVTKDGSHTCFVPALNEHYHSVHGAVQESKHVFIKNGLLAFISTQNTISILEVGLGTGLNVFLTFLENLMLGKNIFYTVVEKYPLKLEHVSLLNYSKILKADKFHNIFEKIHFSEWNEFNSLNEKFHLKKINENISEVFFNERFDLVYFDAFAPKVQPELWTRDVFDKMNECMNPGGFLVTYCAQGEVKRTMKSSGFNIESLEGPPGKREMTKAVKKS